MQKYIVCAVLLFCHNFNFSSEKSFVVKIEEPSRLCTGSDRSFCSWKSCVGPLCVIAVLGLCCVWSNENSRAWHEISSVNCVQDSYSMPVNAQAVGGTMCMALSVDGKNNQPVEKKNGDQSWCSLTAAQQEEMVQFALATQEEKSLKKLRKGHRRVVGNGLYRKGNKINKII